MGFGYTGNVQFWKRILCELKVKVFQVHNNAVPWMTHDYVTKREAAGPSKTTNRNRKTHENRGTKDGIQMWQGVAVLTELWWNGRLTEEMQSTDSICMSLPLISVSL